ncbi:MAG: hypothetical protein LBQ22_02435 [Bacteroidales bacterium]|jgi:hypothetical protein|nr:hypothetical protein [Bacteroidales bacterium]
MSRLKNIVGSILNEFTQAQHMANSYAARLGKEYAENDLLRYFMIPNACADELSFELKFAVQQSGQTEQLNEINYSKLMQFFNQLSVSIAETVITTAIYTVDGFVAKDPNNYRKIKEKEQQLKNDFREFLTKRLKAAFLKKGINEVDDDGYLYFPKIFEIAMEVIEQEFFSHKELNFSENNSKEFSDKVKEACGSFVETLIEHSCKDVNLKEIKEEEIFDIIIDAESLSKIQAENIQKINFKVNLRNYQVSPTENNGEVIDYIIPASM